MLAALPLAGCGFAPVYGRGGAARGLRGQLDFDLVETRPGFLMREELVARFGSGGPDARFAVKVTPDFTTDDLVIDATAGIARHELHGKVEIAVTDRTTGKVVFTDTLRDTTGYSSTAATVASNAARRDAETRLSRSLAEAVAARLAETAGAWAG